MRIATQTNKHTKGTSCHFLRDTKSSVLILTFWWLFSGCKIAAILPLQHRNPHVAGGLGCEVYFDHSSYGVGDCMP